MASLSREDVYKRQFKGSSYADEVSNSIKVIEMLGGTIEKISIVKIPNTDYLRYLLVIKKIKPTPCLLYTSRCV